MTDKGEGPNEKRTHKRTEEGGEGVRNRRGTVEESLRTELVRWIFPSEVVPTGVVCGRKGQEGRRVKASGRVRDRKRYHVNKTNRRRRGATHYSTRTVLIYE